MSPDSSEEVAQHYHARPKLKVSTALKSRPQQRPARGGLVAPLTAENLDSKNAKVNTMIERNKILQAAAHFDVEISKKSPRRKALGEQMAVVDGSAKDSASPTWLYPVEKMTTITNKNPVFETRPVRRPEGDGVAVVSRTRGHGGRRGGEIKNTSKTPHTAPLEGRRASSGDGIGRPGNDIAEALSSTASVAGTTGSSSAVTMVTKQSVVGRKRDGNDGGGGEGGDQQLLAWLNEVLCPPAVGGTDTTEENRPLRSLAELGDYRLLSVTVRRMAGQDLDGSERSSPPPGRDGSTGSFGGDDAEDDLGLAMGNGGATGGTSASATTARGRLTGRISASSSGTMSTDLSGTASAAVSEGATEKIWSRRSRSGSDIDGSSGTASGDAFVGVDPGHPAAAKTAKAERRGRDQRGSRGSDSSGSGCGSSGSMRCSRSVSPARGSERISGGEASSRGMGSRREGRRSTDGRDPKDRSSSKIRSFLALPAGWKKERDKASARKVKKDVACLLTGASLAGKQVPRLPVNIDKAVDEACAGDVDAVRRLLLILRECQIRLNDARVSRRTGGVRRRSRSCEPGPRAPNVPPLATAVASPLAEPKPSSSWDAQAGSTAPLGGLTKPAATNATGHDAVDSSTVGKSVRITSVGGAGADAGAVAQISSSSGVMPRKPPSSYFGGVPPAVKATRSPSSTPNCPQQDVVSVGITGVKNLKASIRVATSKPFGDAKTGALVAAGVLTPKGDAAGHPRGTRGRRTAVEAAVTSDAELQEPPVAVTDTSLASHRGSKHTRSGQDRATRSALSKGSRGKQGQPSSSPPPSNSASTVLASRNASRSRSRSTRSPSPAEAEDRFAASGGSLTKEIRQQTQPHKNRHQHGLVAAVPRLHPPAKVTPATDEGGGGGGSSAPDIKAAVILAAATSLSTKAAPARAPVNHSNAKSRPSSSPAATTQDKTSVAVRSVAVNEILSPALQHRSTFQAALAAAQAVDGSGSGSGSELELRSRSPHMSASKPKPELKRPPMPPLRTRPSLSSSVSSSSASSASPPTSVLLTSAPSSPPAEPRAPNEQVVKSGAGLAVGTATKRITEGACLAANDGAVPICSVPPKPAVFAIASATKGGHDGARRSPPGHRPYLSQECIHRASTAKHAPRRASAPDPTRFPVSSLTSKSVLLASLPPVSQTASEDRAMGIIAGDVEVVGSVETKGESLVPPVGAADSGTAVADEPSVSLNEKQSESASRVVAAAGNDTYRKGTSITSATNSTSVPHNSKEPSAGLGTGGTGEAKGIADGSSACEVKAPSRSPRPTLVNSMEDASRATPPGNEDKPESNVNGPVLAKALPGVSSPTGFLLYQTPPRPTNAAGAKNVSNRSDRAEEKFPASEYPAQGSSTAKAHEAKLLPASKKIWGRRKKDTKQSSTSTRSRSHSSSRLTTTSAAAAIDAEESNGTADAGEGEKGGVGADASGEHSSASKDERRRRSSRHHGEREHKAREPRERRRRRGVDEEREHRKREGSRRDPHHRSALAAERKRCATPKTGHQEKASSPVGSRVEPSSAAAAAAFGSVFPEGVRSVVEFVGSVEGVARCKAVCASWRRVVTEKEDRLFKLVVRRAGVTPKCRAAFWEHMILRRPYAEGKAPDGDDSVPARDNSNESGASGSGRRASLSELSRMGGDSRWSKAIDADVARTFGRPTSFRGSGDGMDVRRERRRHWWPESLGGAPLGAMSPLEKHPSDGDKTNHDHTATGNTNKRSKKAAVAAPEGWEMVEHALVAPSSMRSRTSGKQHHRQFSRNRLPPDPAALLESAAAAAAAAATDLSEQRRGHNKTASITSSVGSPGMFSALVALPPPEGSRRAGARSIRAKGGRDRGSGGGNGKGRDNRLMLPGTARQGGGHVDRDRDGSGASSSLILSTIQPSYSEGFSTLSPRGSDGSMGSATGSEAERVEPPSPGTLKQLAAVKAQLTDLLRALAVSFGQVGYCQGLDYVAAHLIKCLGTDSDRSFASDPERVFTVLLGLFRGYGLQYLYSEDLAALQLMLRVLDELIETHLPRLHKHFQEQDVAVAFFAVGWFQTLFLYTSRMPSETLMWLWDVWVTERSFKVFFRASLAILQLSEPRLLELDMESILLFLSRFPQDGILDKETLVPTALAIKITDSKLREAQRKLDEAKNPAASGLGWSRPTRDDCNNNGNNSNNGNNLEDVARSPSISSSISVASVTATAAAWMGARTHSQVSDDGTKSDGARRNSGFSTPSSSSGEGRGTSGAAQWSSGSGGGGDACGNSGSTGGRSGGRPTGGSPLIFGEHSMDDASMSGGGGRVSPSLAPRQLSAGGTAFAAGSARATVGKAAAAAAAAVGTVHARTNPLPLPTASPWIPPDEVDGGDHPPGPMQRPLARSRRLDVGDGDGGGADDMPAEMEPLPLSRATNDQFFASTSGYGSFRSSVAGGLSGQCDTIRGRRMSSASSNAGMDGGGRGVCSGGGGGGGDGGGCGDDDGEHAASKTSPPGKLGGKEEYALVAVGDE